MKDFTFEQAAPVLDWFQRHTPLIHCLTNNVSMNLVANALLAVGASPGMVEAAQEIGEFTVRADNIVINLGSLRDSRLRSISMGVQTAHENGKRWVLDPAAVSDKLFYRSSFARELLSYYPAVIRGNAAEILFLAGGKGESRGADSLTDSTEAIEAAKELAVSQHAVVSVTGATDYVTDGETVYAIRGGSPMLARVTGTGCALSAITAATVLSKRNVIDGAAAACLFMKNAGEYAANHSQGMGTFATALLDGLTIPKKA